jgi:ribosome maturation factor RimP
MSLLETIHEALSPVVGATGFYLEEVHIAAPGKRRVVTCVVDGENSLNLERDRRCPGCRPFHGRYSLYPRGDVSWR